MASAFFFGEIGAGLFLVSLFFDFVPGLIAGVLLTAVGKTTGHMLHLGQPLRAWRAIVRLDRSWVSRGLLAIILFTGFGIAYILCLTDLTDLTFGLLPRGLAPLYGAIAAAAAVVVMLYQGLAMSHSPAIALWSSGLVPVIGLTYACLSGVSLMLALGHGTLLAGQPHAIAFLKAIEIGLMVYAFIMIACLMHAASYGSKGGQKSVAMLLRGHLAKWFVSLVLVVGFAVPGLVIAFGPDSVPAAVVTAVAVLMGYYTFRVLILKAGVYDPIQDFSSEAGCR